MAQPVAASSVEFAPNDDADEDFLIVCEERKQKAAAIAQTADTIFSSLRQSNTECAEQSKGDEASPDGISAEVVGQSKREMGKQSSKKSGQTGDKETPEDAKPFSTVPPYFPLLPDDSAVACMSLCLDLLGKGRTPETAQSPPPPGIVQAVLSLLMRLLRSPKMASLCLGLGAAELILSLPRECRFSGNSGVATVILRRLLEDEPTLQSMMASEIRHTLSKLDGEKSRKQDSSNDRPRVSSRSFVQAVTPLICRDPVSFLKAAATTVCVEPDDAKTKATDGNTMVVLLTPDQSARNSRALADLLSTRDPPVSGSVEKRGQKAPTKAQRQKSGSRTCSSKRCVPSKKSKKEKNDAPGKRTFPINGSPSNHIMCLLMAKVVALARQRQDDTGTSDSHDGSFYGEQNSFLWLADALEIMANLVLAVPSCAAAIHRYRASNVNRSANGNSCIAVSHALSGCPCPPRTFLNFLLHSALPQDRWTFKREQLTRDPNIDNEESAKIRMKTAHMTARVAQASARLLVALVARVGEGRRRVIADLAFALSGGSLGHASSCPVSSPAKLQGPDDYEFHALQAWGDLCIGLAAPRSNGSSNENTSTLSFEVVKLMLDFGMAHALLYAIHRVRLQHPMAASTSASLLLPLEVFTRGSVSDSVQAIADKESSESDKPAKQTDNNYRIPTGKKHLEGAASVSAGPSQRNESAFADDSMLEDGFDAETAARTSRSREPRGAGIGFDDEDEHMEDAVGQYDMIVDNVEENNESDEDEMEMEEDDEMDDEADSDDEEISSDDDSGITEDIEEGSDAESDDDDEDGSVDSQNDTIDADFDDEAEDREGQGWDEGNTDDFLQGSAEEEDNEGGAIGQGEFEMDEGWTRIETNGFGGMLFRRRGSRPAAASNLSVRSRGFIDAAEAMIGTLLRTGDIDGNALSEIEGTLGIRIMPQNRDLSESDEDIRDRLFAGVSRREPRASDPTRPVASDSIVSLPHVHQRSPPEAGYTAMGNGGRWNEISAMEYVYGGPSVAAGSQNYDLTRIRPLDTDADSYPTPSQIDMRLFPGGPAAATHSRTEPSLHPLLCGVDLPPVNALVSDLQPYGTRAVHRTQTNRRPGNWITRSVPSGGYLVSTTGGNVVRLNRAPRGPFADSGTGASTRTTSGNGLLGWTDDGLPFDGTVTDFSTAFERALGESMLATETRDEAVAAGSGAQQPVEVTISTTARERDGNGSAFSDEEARRADSNRPDDSGMRDVSTQSSQAAENDGQETGAVSIGVSVDDSPPEDSGERGASSSLSNDGDGVASSLAAALRLSPRREEISSSDEAMVAETQPEEAPQEDNRISVAAALTGPDSADTSGPMQEDEPEQPAESHVDEPVTMEEEQQPQQQAESQADASMEAAPVAQAHEGEVLTCPSGMDQEVFNCLPEEMQREVVEQNRVAAEVAGQLDAASGLDPEALAALPEDMRQEVIEQDQRERRLREEVPADPSNAEEMDNASFLVSLAPDLREEILLTADETFLNSLPPNIIAEAQILRERASMQYRRANDDPLAAAVNGLGQRTNNSTTRNGAGSTGNSSSGQIRKKQRPGKMRLECDRSQILYLPSHDKQLSPLPGVADMKVLLRLLYLRSPVRPQRLLQKVFQNICTQGALRNVLCTAFVQLLNDNGDGAVAALQTITKDYSGEDDWRKKIDAEFADGTEGFPPLFLIGAAPEVVDAEDFNASLTRFRRRPTSSTADSIAASLPTSEKGSSEEHLPSVVATSIIDTLLQLSKSSPRICMDALKNELVGGEFLDKADRSIIFDKLLDLLEKPRYSKSSANLEQLLNLIEIMVSPLSLLPKIGEEEHEISQRDIDAAAASGKEWAEVPRIVVSQSRLNLLCSILRMESCRDGAFTKVNSIARRLCRVDANRGYILSELGTVAQSLATDAIRDLKTLNIRMQDAASHRQQEMKKPEEESSKAGGPTSAFGGGGASSSVTLSISSSELKLLRVLQTLQSLCFDTSQDEGGKKDGKIYVTDQLVEIFQSMMLDDLWTQLDSCLHVVKVLEGVTTVEEMEEKNGGNDDDDASDDGPGGKKLQNSVAGLLTRFLPVIEAFFVVNASSRSTRGSETSKEKADEDAPAPSSPEEDRIASLTEATSEEAPTVAEPQQPSAAGDSELSALIGGERLVEFVQANRVLLNALVRNNPGLLEKGLRAMVQVSRCRVMLDFDVKRHWFKTQVRRLRQHASRRHGSLRLSIRRKYVFEDAYHQLRLRNADEMRGRLHITFRNEEGVDAGGLSREFFGILAKEIFNPNYALFTSTEDGCTFQPNPNSSINPDHLSYFRFVGRIVGKAVADGFLLDAHFTRSLYKHMLGLKVSRRWQLNFTKGCLFSNYPFAYLSCTCSRLSLIWKQSTQITSKIFK